MKVRRIKRKEYAVCFNGDDPQGSLVSSIDREGIITTDDWDSCMVFDDLCSAEDLVEFLSCFVSDGIDDFIPIERELLEDE